MKHEIVRKDDLNSQDYLIEVKAPDVAKKFQAGQFAVLITNPKGERIPMSVQKAENLASSGYNLSSSFSEKTRVVIT
jgi:ferredoxin--NADP+ reductase